MTDMRQSIVTCHDLFSLPLLGDAILLAGKEGLDKHVRRVNVMEVPDVIDWVQQGEFLMTTGYPLRDNLHTFVELIRQLSAKGVVALGIKTKRFVENIPNEVIELADSLKFPLIELPPQTIFSEVIHEVMELVLSFEMFQLTVLQERLQSITGLLMDGGSIQEMLQELENLIKQPILFLDSHSDIIVTEQTKTNFLNGIVINRNWSQFVISQIETESRNGYFDTFHLQIDEQWKTAYFSRIHLPYGRKCYLLLVSNQSTLLEIDTLTIERINPIVVLELLNLEARRSVEHKYWDQFMQDWLFGRLENDAEWKVRARLCGFDFQEQSLYAVALLTDRRTDLHDMPIRKSLVKQLDESANVSDDLNFHALLLDHQIVVFVEISREAAGKGDSQFRKLLERTIQAEIFDDYSVHVGKIVQKNELYKSYGEALKIQQISEQCGMNQSLLTYDDLSVFPLLAVLPDCDELQHFRKKFIEPLLAFEKNHHLNIIETLGTYFHCNQNMKLTAEKLFTHYNTIVYRMDRIRHLLGFDLDQADVRLQLHLALKLYHLDQSKKTRNES